eukprot:TRINITY_DN2326_c2_g1_i1.p1 TRINITY_DN2326_c2_g1~~TRINITY_DN2326_c2_g1_i1.p1  ORF type:complete len:197 (+),score=23.36 TRINITY_DN2326_c2_g1_i1:24-614(+)
MQHFSILVVTPNTGTLTVLVEGHSTVLMLKEKLAQMEGLDVVCFRLTCGGELPDEGRLVKEYAATGTEEFVMQKIGLASLGWEGTRGEDLVRVLEGYWRGSNQEHAAADKNYFEVLTAMLEEGVCGNSQGELKALFHSIIWCGFVLCTELFISYHPGLCDSSAINLAATRGYWGLVQSLKQNSPHETNKRLRPLLA